MKKVFISFLCLPFILKAQVISLDEKASHSSGIKWTTGLSWGQVKQKAKSENKYIFLDCFATWCGPCKQMDKETYINDSVGMIFNKSFISIRVQMDKTHKDNDEVKSWYKAVEEIDSLYKIQGFPTYLFLSPEGRIIHSDHGFKDAKKFIEVGKIALRPGQAYSNPYAEYDQLALEFKQGRIDQSRIPLLFNTAVKIKQNVFAREVLLEYSKYLKTLREEELYKKETIELLANPQLVITSGSKFFNMFYKNEKRIDDLMRQKGYSEIVVDRVIQREVIDSVLKIKKSSMMVKYANPKDISSPPAEPNWNELEKEIQKKYNKKYAERNVLDAKIKWYQYHHLTKKVLENYFLRFEKYGVAVATIDDDLWLNHWSWEAFLQIDDHSILKTAARQMKGLVQRSARYHPNFHGICIDTYANLLYKIGRKKEAIKLEEQAVEHAINAKLDASKLNTFSGYLKQMKNGKPTWPIEVTK